jgi:AraC-like DNA-binding protein
LLQRARAVTLTNYLEVARYAGLDPEKMLAEAGLTAAQLDDPERWVPARKVLKLIEDSAARSGRDDFGVLLGRSRSLTSLGPVSLLIKHEATVRDIILAVSEYKYLLNDLLHIDLRDDGETAVIEWNLIPALNSTQGVNLLASIAYIVISETLEAHWDPDCIHFRHAAPKHEGTFRRLFRCGLEFDSSFDGMSCTSSHLLTPNPFADEKLAAYARQLLNLLPNYQDDSAAGKVRSLIPMLLEDGRATAECVAECLDVPIRTLQRRLIYEGTSFTALLNEARAQLVTRYLANSSHPLTLIAELAGYSSLSAFTRWFTGEFGMPPATWRRRNAGKLVPLENVRHESSSDNDATSDVK